MDSRIDTRKATTDATLLLVAAAACAALISGCGHGKLVAAKSAKVVKGSDSAAFVDTGGLRCSADTEAWQGREGTLPERVTPIKVRLRNQTGAPVRVRYEDFALVGKDGRRYLPLPLLPLDSDSGGDHLTIRPLFSASKFFIAPAFSDAYPAYKPWAQPLSRDEALYASKYAEWGEAPLPRSVLRAGLPEGVLEDGGTVTGFLYFEDPTRHEDRVTFEAQIEVDPNAEARVAEIKIPFRVD